MCEGTASKSCVCRKVSYCNKQCQRKHWTQHRPDCGPFLLQEVEGKGRGLVAARNIKFGEEILREKPLLLIRNGEQTNLLSWSNCVLEAVGRLGDTEREELESLADNTMLDQSPEFLYLSGVRGLRQVLSGGGNNV